MRLVLEDFGRSYKDTPSYKAALKERKALQKAVGRMKKGEEIVKQWQAAVNAAVAKEDMSAT